MANDANSYDIRETLLEMPGVVSAHVEKAGSIMFAYLTVLADTSLTEDEVFQEIGLPRREFCVQMQRVNPLAPGLDKAA